MVPSFILFQGRLLGTAHLMTLAPPRADSGKQIIEARCEGGLAYVEEYDDPDEAAGRYLELASLLLGDPGIAAGVRKVDFDDDHELAEVTPLPHRGSLLQ